MTVYKCPRCHYESEYMCTMKRHFNKKYRCTFISDDLSIEQCNNIFKTKKNNKKEEDNKIKKLEEQLKISQEQVFELTKKVGNNNGNTINISINSFADTKYNLMRDTIIEVLQNNKGNVPMFEKLVDLLHFDKDKPDNHNVYKPNIKDDRVLAFNGNSFIVDRMAMTVILKNLEDMIMRNVEEPYLKKLKNHLELKIEDREYLEATMDEIALTLYNGREMVKKTHRNNILNSL